jgi:hypothetical protein
MIWNFKIKDDKYDRPLANKIDNYIKCTEGIKKNILDDDKYNEAIDQGSKEVKIIHKDYKN